jgi:hypothetical protein
MLVFGSWQKEIGRPIGKASAAHTLGVYLGFRAPPDDGLTTIFRFVDRQSALSIDPAMGTQTSFRDITSPGVWLFEVLEQAILKK